MVMKPMLQCLDVLGSHRLERARTNSVNLVQLLLFLLVCCVTYFVLFRPVVELLSTPTLYHSTSNREFELPLGLDSATDKGSEFKVGHDIVKPKPTTIMGRRSGDQRSGDHLLSGVQRSGDLRADEAKDRSQPDNSKVLEPEFKMDVAEPTAENLVGRQSGYQRSDDQLSGDQRSGDFQIDEEKDRTQPSENLHDTEAFNPEFIGPGFKEMYNVVEPTPATTKDKKSGDKRSGDRPSGDIRFNEVKDHTHSPGESHEIEVDKPKIVEPTEPHVASKQDQTARKVKDKTKSINRTTVHWAKLEEESSYTSVNHIYRSESPPSLPATNTTLPQSGWCHRQVHLWRDMSLGASGRVGDFTCIGLPCRLRLVVNKDLWSLRSSDAVILYDMTRWDWMEMFRFRPNGQRWIFYTMESPINTPKRIIPPREAYDNTYDYVMSYRSSESHLYASYGYYKPHTSERQITEIQNWAENRTTVVAWMASNCKAVSWDRQGFVEALSRYIPVTRYGRCGAKSCKKGNRCHRKLRKHKFYLALENSACREYITEKVWVNAFHNDLVPVVFGAPREDYQRLLPPNSFIYVEDFPSVSSLAKYLLKLHKNDTLYNAYFEWKKLGTAEATTEKWLMEPEQICSNVVRKLLDDEKAMTEGTFQTPRYPDWNEWWTNSCLPVDPKSWPIKLR